MRMPVPMQVPMLSSSIPPKHPATTTPPHHELAIARAQAYAQAQARLRAANRANQQFLAAKDHHGSTTSPVTTAVAAVAAARRSQKARSASSSRHASPQKAQAASAHAANTGRSSSVSPVKQQRQPRPGKQQQQQQQQHVEWRVAIDPRSKRPYYYHPVTRETTWKKPQELIDRERHEKAQFFSAMESNIRAKLRTGNWLHASENDEDADEADSNQCSRASTCSSSSGGASETEEIVDDVALERALPRPNAPFQHVSKSLPSTPQRSDDLVAAAAKPPLLFRTLSSYETPVVQSKKGRLVSIPSPIQERVRLASLTPSDEGEDDSTSLTTQQQPLLKSQENLLQQPLRRRSNSTSTIFVRMGTMNAPDQDCTIQCVTTVLRAHLIEAQAAPIAIDSKFDVFINKRDQRAGQSGVVPSLKEISSFMKHVFSRAQMESECIIMSLVYVERLLKATSGSLQLTPANWRSILFCSMVMASKVWDDLSMCNADFSKIWPELSLKEINELELAYLSAVEYNVRVSAVSYAKYYFHLRSMCASMGTLKAFDATAPLNLDGARKMQVLSEEYQERSKLMPVPRRRSVTITSAAMENKASSAAKSASIEQLVQMQVRGAGGSSLAGMHRLSKPTKH
ncbi:TPA: hypothetical protein N0F65_001440 [Lagenidium giganteum]|uniref:WW domain-containing protein n=1 Tax=Lagenidium giganteum TaxID=4803 RepID=A0AAV2Z2M8_9STRA|nr:TPA: hypothetical protein N0F65_001440 [Lagenidium giganteum]